jgi:signal transduction histidine kinase
MISTNTHSQDSSLQPVDFNELIKQSVLRLRYLEGVDKTDIRFSVDAKAPFYGNQKLLNVVFNNFISNGIKYRKITGDNSSIIMRVFVNEQKAVITIEDNGIGIAPDEITKIFNLFYTSGSGELGRGMGLYMAKEIIEKLGGRITVESALNIGTAFTFEIPNHIQQLTQTRSYFE